jgi:uncharacterized protein (TIGR02145 family)
VNCGISGNSGTDVGIQMKSTTGWNLGGNGTNTSGFTALPGGYFSISFGGYFTHIGNSTYYWSSTTEYDYYKFARFLSYSNSYIGRSSINEFNGSSVRCIKNYSLP